MIPLGLFHRAAALSLAAASYITLKKLFNLVRCETEKRRRISRPRSLPYVAIIDITNTCNLRCPYCPTGKKRNAGRINGMIDPLNVQRLIDEVEKYLISANLFNLRWVIDIH